MELLLNGFTEFFSPLNMLLILLGVFIGIVFGAIPGLTGTMGIALCLPFTYTMDIIPSFCLLLAIFIGGISGGLISAILINIPGTPASVGTTFDGAPMAAKGQAGKALAVGVFYSFIGTMIGIIILSFVAPLIGKIAIKISAYEYFAVAVFSLTLVSALSGKSLAKGLIACCIGILAASVGTAPIDNVPRFTLGIKQLSAGFSQVPVLVGLFALSEILKASKGLSTFHVDRSNIKIKGVGVSRREFVEQTPNMLMSGILGTFIGIMPGIGAATCNIMAYGLAKKTSRHPEKFGSGIIDGIIATETSNNASIGGAMVPLITLGIPGDAVTAVLLGALTMQGLQPGPMFFTTNVKLIYTIFAIMFVCSIVCFVVQYFGLKGFIQLLRIPKNILLPMVMVLCMIGAFGVNNRIFDVWTFLLFGVIGFLLSKFGFPLTPVIMGYVLGGIVETYFRRGLMLSRGSFLPFITRPVSAVFLGFAAIIVLYTAFTALINLIKKKKAVVSNAEEIDDENRGTRTRRDTLSDTWGDRNDD